MKSARLVCSLALLLSAILLILLAAAQSNPVLHANAARALSAPKLPATATAQPAPLAPKLPVAFAKPVTYSTGAYGADSVAVADLNGDGHLDLVVANSCLNGGACYIGQVSVLLGNGDGTFQTPVTYSTGAYYGQSVAIADVNRDGLPDLVVADYCQTDCTLDGLGAVSVLLGNGNGTFQPAVTYSAGAYYTDFVAIGDFNGDGLPDLAVASLCQDSNCENGAVSVLLGKGDGTFQSAVTYSSNGYDTQSVVIGDLNGDGHPDLVVANFCQTSSCNSSNGEVGVLLGNGDGTFQPVATYASGGTYAESVAIGDVNGDGHPDLAVTTCQDVTCATGEVGVLLGNGDGTFQAAVVNSSGGAGGGSVAIGDVNGDGVPDMIAANNCRTSLRCSSTSSGGVSVLLGKGDGTFQTPVTYASGGCCGGYSVKISDLNGDGRPDLIVTNYCQTSQCNNGDVAVLLNKTFTSTITKLTSSLNPSQVNQPVTFTATITSAIPVPDGEVVTFYSSKSSLGTGTTTNGVATLTTSFSQAKTYAMRATYSGDVFHKTSSGTVKQVVD